ncbi:unnamed protein product [Somion occarium]|uniref:Uncharacterized protein n=1 Tax=Somion occarium TaxID=3059160 RepID=A0ABP1E337_9APHY
MVSSSSRFPTRIANSSSIPVRFLFPLTYIRPVDLATLTQERPIPSTPHPAARAMVSKMPTTYICAFRNCACRSYDQTTTSSVTSSETGYSVTTQIGPVPTGLVILAAILLAVLFFSLVAGAYGLVPYLGRLCDRRSARYRHRRSARPHVENFWLANIPSPAIPTTVSATSDIPPPPYNSRHGDPLFSSPPYLEEPRSPINTTFPTGAL